VTYYLGGMIYNHPVQNEIDLWEAWIEFDHEHPKAFGTLYVLGEIIADKKTYKYNFVQNVDPAEPHRLILQVYTSPVINGTKQVEVSWSETVSSAHIYSSVVIYVNDELVSEIDDLEIVV
jgi:hypothetical protein